MKVDELRSILVECDQDTTRKLVVEMYKLIPKKMREDVALDEFISTFSITKGSLQKARTKQDLISDFNELKNQALTFVECAAAGLYIAPNRIVSKVERSKWRVAARRLIKSLITVKGENADEAALCLMEMYRMLSHACSYHLFNTENPFSAVGFSQPELLEITLAKFLSQGLSQKRIRVAIYLTLESHVDRETLHSQLLGVLLWQLKTVDLRLMALEECEYFMQNFRDQTLHPYFSDHFLLTYTKKSWGLDYSDAVTERCAELYLRISVALHEHAKGIKYFKEHFHRGDSEVNLYCLLSVIYGYTEDPKLAEVWIQTYDEAIKRGVTPRNRLVELRIEVEKGLVCETDSS